MFLGWRSARPTPGVRHALRLPLGSPALFLAGAAIPWLVMDPNDSSSSSPPAERTHAREGSSGWALRIVGLFRDGTGFAEPGETALLRTGLDSYSTHWDGGDASVTEEWIPDPDGLRQELMIWEAPSGPDELRVLMQLPASWTATGLGPGEGVDLTSPAGGRLSWSGLMVLDATGARLPSRMEIEAPGVIAYVISDRDTRYPLWIDPVLSSVPDWTAEGDLGTANFGGRPTSAGDVQGDGYSDVLVGAYQYGNGQAGEGRAYLYGGSASGLSSSPVWTAEGNQGTASFGVSAFVAGDVQGDGYSDILIGAYAYDNGQVDEGRSYLFAGSASGLVLSPAWTAESNLGSVFYGVSVYWAGDVQGDGFSDAMVGSDFYFNGTTEEGRGFLYLGSTTGLARSPAWTAEGEGTSAYFSQTLCSAGDVQGDGYSDVVATAYNYGNGQAGEGRVSLFAGGSTGLSAAPSWTAECDQAFANFGNSASGMGDVQGDGYSDLIVGTPYFDNGQSDKGRTFLYPGSSGGLATTPAWTAENNQATSLFGFGVSMGGDVQGDGYSDVLAGARAFGNGQAGEGRAYLYTGSGIGLATSPVWTVESDQGSADFARWVGVAGDVQGDGHSDVLVGTASYDNGLADEGRAYLFQGGPLGLPVSPAMTAESDLAGAQLGYAVSSAGDVDGDGFSDVIASAKFYANGQVDEGRLFLYRGTATGISTAASWTAESDLASAVLGEWVAPAGDVDGNGYSDIVVGTPLYVGNAALVYSGSASGLARTPGWATSASGNFGIRVGGAGDVNGDGYTEIVVGAHLFTNTQSGEGRATLFLGSPTGLSSGASWTAEPDQATARFGAFVAGAGDVHGDGFSDVLVGSFMYDNGLGDEGRSWLYAGSATGASTAPAWTAESDQLSAYSGVYLSAAGDVQRDGYGDVIVGLDGYENGQLDEGRVELYAGGAAGPGARPIWTAESDVASVTFGFPATSAGDLEGDGFGDVLIGADVFANGQATEGRLFVYRGESAGLSGQPTWTAEGDQASASFGDPSAHAGDVQADGFSDLVAGAPAYGGGQASEGRIHVYYGNAGSGVPYRLRQWEVGGTDPVHVGGKSGTDGTGRFRMSVVGPVSGGCAYDGTATAEQQRTCHRVQVEVRKSSFPFIAHNYSAEACPTTSSGKCGISGPLKANGLTGGVGSDADLTISGLQTAERYHWRARILYPAGSVPAASKWIDFPDPNPMFETDFWAAADATPTATRVSDLAATWWEGSGVEVSWRLAEPTGVISMRVERVLEGAATGHVVDRLDAAGSAFESAPFSAFDSAGGPEHLYQLVLELADGRQETYGPVRASPRSDSAGGCSCSAMRNARGLPRAALLMMVFATVSLLTWKRVRRTARSQVPGA